MLATGEAGMTVEEALRDERLASLPLSAPVWVARGTSLRETLRLMRDQGAGCVLVCEGDRPVGIFTERDVLNKLIGSGVSETEAVDRFMTRDPACLTPRPPLGDPVPRMTGTGHRTTPP